MRVVVLVVRRQGARAAHDLLVAAVAAGDVDPDGDRLLGLVGDHDTRALAALAFNGGGRGWERLRRGRGRAALGRLGSFAQPSRAPADGLEAALGLAFGMALLGR